MSPPQSRFTDSRAKFNCCSRVQTRFSWPPVHRLKRITFQILEKKSDFCAIQLITIIIISSGLGAQCGSIKSAIIILVVISVSVIIQEAEPTTTVGPRELQNRRKKSECRSPTKDNPKSPLLRLLKVYKKVIVIRKVLSSRLNGPLLRAFCN